VTLLTGSCLCGQVRISVQGAPDRVGICHCTDCRQESGSAFTFFGVWPAGQFEHTGETASFSGRSFCPHCGGRVFSLDTQEAEVKLGTLADVPSPLTHSYEMWVRPIEGAEQYDEDMP
jgi:hypothetical protein